MKRIFIIIVVVALGVFIAELMGVEVGKLFKGFLGFLGDLFEPRKHP